jgi:hypothetical protein
MKTRIKNPAYLELKASKLSALSNILLITFIVVTFYFILTISPLVVFITPFIILLPSLVLAENAKDLKDKAYQIRIKYNIKK